MATTICRTHPLTPEHVETLAGLVAHHIDIVRHKEAADFDELAALFKLREVLATMLRKPEAKPRRTRRATTGQQALPGAGEVQS